MAFSSEGSVHRSTVTGTKGMVASAHPLATLAGVRILLAGGNAFDAIVAVASSLNVVEPYMSGIAGVGYALLYYAKEGRVRTLDYCGRTPHRATAEAFADGGLQEGGVKMIWSVNRYQKATRRYPLFQDSGECAAREPVLPWPRI